MKKLILVIILLSTMGCRISYEEFQQKMDNKFLGRTEQEVIMLIGLPDRAYNISGMRVLEYKRSQQEYVPHIDFGGNTYTTQYTNAYGMPIGQSTTYDNNIRQNGGHYQTLFCITDFFLSGGRVVKWNARGNYCY